MSGISVAHRCQVFLLHTGVRYFCTQVSGISAVSLTKRHRRERRREGGRRAVFIPAGCTGELQPLDISVNDIFKKGLKSCFSEWYVSQVSTALSAGVRVEGVSVDLHISVIKLIHANWLMNVLTKLKEQKTTVQKRI